MIDRRLLAACLTAAVFGLGGCTGVRDAVGAVNPFDNASDENLQGEAPGDDERISLISFEEELRPNPDLAGRIELPASFVNRAWSMEGGYPTHTVSHPRVGADLERAWSRGAGEGSSRTSRVVSPPVTMDGRVYAMDGSGDVSAFSADGGSRIWRTRLRSDARRDREARGGGVAVVDDRVYATSGHGFVAALNAETGEEIWRTEVEGPMHAPPTVAGGRVFAVSFDNELFAFSADDGQQLWTYQSIAEPARILTAVAPAVVNDVVIAPFASGEIVALRAPNGRELWSQALAGSSRTTGLSSLNDIAGSPVVTSTTVYAVSHSGVLAALDLRTGERIWEAPAGGISMPWLAGDFLFLVTPEAELTAIRRSDGAVAWVSELQRYENENRRRGRIAWAGPVLAGDRLFLVSSQGRLVAASPQNGEVLQEWRIGGAGFIAPIVANETIYVLNDDAELVAFR